MIYVESPRLDPYWNLALEEYMLTCFSEEIFMLWRNNNAVIVGKNQNTLSEINPDYVRENNIAVVRRLTGGGAVFHDPGNLNFSFMVKNEDELFSDFQKFAGPIVDALRSYGLNAEFGGRNDITIEGKKISGNAQAVIKERLLHHGTLLFNTNFSHLEAALNVDRRKIRSKGIRSVRSRVTNICDYVDIPMDEFISKIAVGENYALTESDLAEVTELADKKYRAWEWNYGYSPKYDYSNEEYFPGGLVEARINVNEGIMTGVKLYGDFFARRDLAEIETALTGVRHEREAVKEALKRFDLNEFFLNISAEEMVGCICR